MTKFGQRIKFKHLGPKMLALDMVNRIWVRAWYATCTLAGGDTSIREMQRGNIHHRDGDGGNVVSASGK